MEGLCYLYFRPNVEARAAIMQPEKIGYKRDCVPAHNPVLQDFDAWGGMILIIARLLFQVSTHRMRHVILGGKLSSNFVHGAQYCAVKAKLP